MPAAWVASRHARTCWYTLSMRVPSRSNRNAMGSDPGSSGVLPFELGMHLNVRIQQFRDRTAGLRGLRGFVPRGLIRLGHPPFDVEENMGDRPPRLQLVERDRGLRFQRFRREPGIAQL